MPSRHSDPIGHSDTSTFVQDGGEAEPIAPDAPPHGRSEQPAPGELPIYLANFLSMFGDKWPHERAREVAERTIALTKESRRDLFAFLEEVRRLHSANDGADLRRWRDRLLRLRGWRPELLDSVLHRGRGLVFCMFHFGDFRSCAFDLSLLGYL